MQSNFNFFSNTIPTYHIPNLNDCLLTVEAIISKYHGSMTMADANEALVEKMLKKARHVNLV